MNALRSAAERVTGLRFGDMHALFWSLAHGLSWPHLCEAFESYVVHHFSRSSLDVLDIGVMLAPCEACRSASCERRVWKLIASSAPLRRDMQEIVAGTAGYDFNPAAYIDRHRVAVDFPGAQVARHGGHAQHKLSMLVQYVEARIVRPATGQDVLAAIVDFSMQKLNYWLKVAGDAKGTLIDRLLARATDARHRIRLEFGAYVGFSTLRLALANLHVPAPSAWRVLSLEVDPLHVCVSRHMLNLGEQAQLAEVCAGQVKDLLPRMLEDFGSCAAGLVFMDHRGTRFHSEFCILERGKLFSPSADILCDNVLHPGAPLYLWQESQQSQQLQRELCIWSLSEFGGDSRIEDWMAYEMYQPFHRERKHLQ